MHKNSCICSAA